MSEKLLKLASVFDKHAQGIWDDEKQMSWEQLRNQINTIELNLKEIDRGHPKYLDFQNRLGVLRREWEERLIRRKMNPTPGFADVRTLSDPQLQKEYGELYSAVNQYPEQDQTRINILLRLKELQQEQDIRMARA